MTTEQLAEILRSTPRTLSAQEVERRIHERDLEQGEYVGNQVVHHEYGESER